MFIDRNVNICNSDKKLPYIAKKRAKNNETLPHYSGDVMTSQMGCCCPETFLGNNAVTCRAVNQSDHTAQNSEGWRFWSYNMAPGSRALGECELLYLREICYDSNSSVCYANEFKLKSCFQQNVCQNAKAKLWVSY